MVEQLRYISKEYILPFLTNNPVIVEAGAHKGRDTIEFAKTWPNATIHAFEPVPELYEKLKQQIAHLPNVFCYNYALSNSSGNATFYSSDTMHSSISSLLQPEQIKQEKPTAQWQPIQVQTISLDEWAKLYSIKQVDLLWLDVQGAELAVLQGADTLLNQISAIHCEVAIKQRYVNQALYPEIALFLASKGFKIQAEALYRQDWGNVLFVKPNTEKNS